MWTGLTTPVLPGMKHLMERMVDRTQIFSPCVACKNSGNWNRVVLGRSCIGKELSWEEALLGRSMILSAA